MIRPAVFATAFVAAFLLNVTIAPAGDRDSDGIADEHEVVLGTDPDRADSLEVVLDDGIEAEPQRARSGYDGSKDVVKVEFGHVAEDRCLWRWTVAAPAHLEDTVFHLYVDADADDSTGRKTSAGAPNQGTDYMLTAAGGSPRITAYRADGNIAPSLPLSCVVAGNQVLLSADIPLARDDKGLRFGLYMLCHTATGAGENPRMSDSSGKIAVVGMPVRSGRKILRPSDHPSSYLVDAAYGTEILQRALADPKNIAATYDTLQLDGYEIDSGTSRKWPHITAKKPGATATTTAPRAGRYHVGFMMFDEGPDERVVIS
ncbi:MAG: hypothetical protein ACYC6Y_19530, partial [Thermoguttaceae bacterium]